MKRCALATWILLITAAGQGCAFQLANKVKSVEDLSTDQIKALREANHDLYLCSVIGGPPVGGNMTLIVVPKDKVFKTFAFMPNCAVDMR